jgi:membrane protein
VQLAQAQQQGFHWSWKQIKELLGGTYKEWSAVEAPRMGASLAYYTILSLAPLLIVVIAVAGFVFGRDAASGALVTQIQGMVGTEGGQAIQSILKHAAEKKSTGVVASIIGFLTLLVGASSVALELRSSMNKIWGVKDPGLGVSGFLKERSYAIAIVLGAGFLLLVSLVVSAVLASVDKFFSGILPMPPFVAEIINVLISLVVIAGILAVIFKFVPAVPLKWRDVWIGAAFTSVLFTIGKTAIGIYLGKASIGSSYGAAGSLIVILVWIYYSAQLLFFGAEFTHVFTKTFGSNPKTSGDAPKPGPPVVEMAIPESSNVPVTHSIAAMAGSFAGLATAAVNVFKADKPQNSGR